MQRPTPNNYEVVYASAFLRRSTTKKRFTQWYQIAYTIQFLCILNYRLFYLFTYGNWCCEIPNISHKSVCILISINNNLLALYQLKLSTQTFSAWVIMSLQTVVDHVGDSFIVLFIPTDLTIGMWLFSNVTSSYCEGQKTSHSIHAIAPHERI